MSPAFFHREKNRSGRDPLVTREKFLPVSGDESEKEGERERILFYFHYLFYLVDFYLQPCLLEIGNC